MQTNAFCKGQSVTGPTTKTTQVGSAVEAGTHPTVDNTIVRVMKLTAIFLLVLCLQAGAQGIAQTITLKGNNLSIEQVFTAVKKQTGYRIAGNKEVLKIAKPVTIDVKDMPLQRFLSQVFNDQPLTWEIVDKNIFISRKPAPPILQPAYTPLPVDLRGRVFDEKGEAIAGVTVAVKGTMSLAITNEAGFFSISANNPDATLLFSAIGYQSQEFKFDPTKQTNSVVLKVKVQEMNAVVVERYNTGYQSLTKERATGAFSKPDMEVVNKRTGTMDIIGRMEGLVPGLQVGLGGSSSISRNGNGTSTQKSIIRGIGTVNGGTDPLYVVNGVIANDFASVNPDDIEDITILKDAAAAAIWGARAANGVLVITTKSGSKNQRLNVSYSGFVNYSGKPYFGPNRMMNSQEYIQAAKETFDPVYNSWGSRIYGVVAPHDQILYDQYRGRITAVQANKSLDSLAAIDNTSQIRDLWMRSAFTTNHTASVSGGNNTYSFYGSLGYTGVTSATPGERNNAYKLNFSQNLNIGRRVKLSLNTSAVNSVTSRKNAITIGNNFLPYQLFKDEAGNSLSMNYLTGYTDSLRRDYETRSRISLQYNPLDEMDYSRTNSNTLHMNVTANLTINIWKGLSFIGSYGYLKAPGSITSYTDNKAIEIRKQIVSLTVAPTAASTPVYYYPLTGGVYTTTSNDQRNYTVRNQLVYDAQPRQGKDNLTIQVGQEAQEQSSFNASSTVVGYDEKLGTYATLNYAALQNGVPGTVTGYGYLYVSQLFQDKQFSRYNSLFGLASYTINHKYSIDASWRRDHSNQFGSDVSTQNKPIWSFGAKWQLGRETFLQPAKWLNELGLRATLGITGNSPYSGAATPSDILRSVSASNSGGMGGGAGQIAGDGLTISSPVNRKLSWETTRTLNIGADFAVLNRRISGSINWYSRITTDMLGSVPLNPLTGTISFTGNLGKMSNKGVELNLRSINLQSKNWQWSTAVAFSYNTNKLVSFAKLNPVLNTASYRMQGGFLAGYAMKSLFAYQFAGLDNMGDPQIYTDNRKNITKQMNTAKPEDVLYMGTTQPRFTGGFTNTVGYKGFSLMTNIVFNAGAKMRRPVNSFYTGLLASRQGFQNANYNAWFVDRWKQPGDEARTNIPSYVSNEYLSWTRRDVSYYTNGDLNVISAAYVKLRDVSLSYSFGANALKALNMQSMSVFVQTNNFLLWTDNGEKIDPDRQTGAGRHGYALGVNLSF